VYQNQGFHFWSEVELAGKKKKILLEPEFFTTLYSFYFIPTALKHLQFNQLQILPNIILTCKY